MASLGCVAASPDGGCSDGDVDWGLLRWLRENNVSDVVGDSCTFLVVFVLFEYILIAFDLDRPHH